MDHYTIVKFKRQPLQYIFAANTFFAMLREIFQPRSGIIVTGRSASGIGMDIICDGHQPEGVAVMQIVAALGICDEKKRPYQLKPSS